MAITDVARLAMLGLPKYIRDRIGPLDRKTYLYGEMKSRGKITMNNGGEVWEWRPRKRVRDLTWGPGNPNVVSFPNTNVHTRARLTPKTCYMGESVREIELLAAADQETAFFKKTEDIGKQVANDFMIRFPPKLYADGTDTDVIDGILSYAGVSGNVSNEPVGNPSGTYAGISMALGAEGDWSAPTSGGWPRVNDPDGCDFEYHYWSPLTVDYNHGLLLPADDTDNDSNWDGQWVFACRYLVTYMQILTGETPQVIVLCPDLLRRAKNSLRKYQKFDLAETSRKLDAGIQVLTYDGMTFATEFGAPTGRGCAINFDHCELRVMGNEFIRTLEDVDPVTADKLYRFSWFGNWWVDSPAYHGFLKGISTAET